MTTAPSTSSQPVWAKKFNGMILGWCCYGVDFHIYTTFKPKESTKTGLDLKGYKMRSTPTYRPFLTAMGAIPVTMAAAEMYTGLQRGVVKGLAWPEGALAKYGVQKFLKYRVYPGFYRSGSMVVINLDKFKSLSKSVQDKLVQTGLAFEQGSEPILRKKADTDNEKLWASGLQKLHLKGEARKAYLHTIYELSWQVRKDKPYTVPFAKLKEKMYPRALDGRVETVKTPPIRSAGSGAFYFRRRSGFNPSGWEATVRAGVPRSG